MNKNESITVSLTDEVLTYDFANYRVDIEFLDGVAVCASFSHMNEQNNNKKRDAEFLDYFNNNFAIPVSSIYYEVFKSDAKAVRLVVDSDRSFGVYYHCETIGSNIQKFEFAYSGMLKVVA